MVTKNANLKAQSVVNACNYGHFFGFVFIFDIFWPFFGPNQRFRAPSINFPDKGDTLVVSSSKCVSNGKLSVC